MSRRRALAFVFGFVLTLALVVGAGIVRDGTLAPEAFARPATSIVVTDRHGAALRIVRPDGVDHTWVELDEVSPHFLRAVIAAEDARFEAHDGVDLYATARAVLTPLLPGRRRSGASTIAQQVVKLTHPRDVRARVRSKLVEIVRARRLVAAFGRARVLEEYVNRLPFGNHIVGVERAARVYFGKPASALTLAEAALLAGIPQAPSQTEPFRHIDRARRRRGYVITRLEAAGLYTPDVIAAARVAPIVVAPRQRVYRAPRFVDRVLGSQGHPSRVATTLDLDLQTRGESLLRDAVRDGSALGVTNACGLVLHVPTGEVRAYVGAALDGEGAEGGQLDLLTRRRHPGSTLKPFAYRAFFERGGLPVSTLADSAYGMTDGDGRTYEAENFDGAARGRVSARTALASSLNLAALDVARRVGADVLTRDLRRFGFGGVVSADEHGGAVVLGGISVTPLELARAYLTLARGGESVAPTFVPTTSPRVTRVAGAASVALVTDILMDEHARAEGFGADLASLASTAPFALKTGTSPEFRDAWAAVYDAEYVVVVWFGDPRGRPTREATGFRVAAPVAARWLGMARTPGASSTIAARAPTPSRETLALCTRSGQRAGASCPVRYESIGDHPPATTCDGRHDQPTRSHRDGPRLVHPRDGATFLVGAGADPTLRVRVEGAGPFRITLDGARVQAQTIPLALGHHVLVVADARGRTAEARFDVVSARASLLRVRVRDDLRRDAERRPEPLRRRRDVALRRREADVERLGDLLERELFTVA